MTSQYGVSLRRALGELDHVVGRRHAATLRAVEVKRVAVKLDRRVAALPRRCGRLLARNFALPGVRIANVVRPTDTGADHVWILGTSASGEDDQQRDRSHCDMIAEMRDAFDGRKL